MFLNYYRRTAVSATIYLRECLPLIETPQFLYSLFKLLLGVSLFFGIIIVDYLKEFEQPETAQEESKHPLRCTLIKRIDSPNEEVPQTPSFDH